MAAPYSIDLRLSSVKAYERGNITQEEIVRLYDLGIATFKRYWKRYKETGNVDPMEYKRGRKPALNEKQMWRIKELVLQQPDASLKELCYRYNGTKNKKASVALTR